MSQLFLKLMLLMIICVCSSQTSWGGPFDSTQMTPLNVTKKTCNTTFYAPLVPAGSNYIGWNSSITVNFNRPDTNNMCPGINYTVEIGYSYKPDNCGGGNCCGFGDLLYSDAVTLFFHHRALGNSYPCFSQGVATPPMFYTQGTWKTSDGQIYPLILYSGVSDAVYFLSGYIYIHQ